MFGLFSVFVTFCKQIAPFLMNLSLFLPLSMSKKTFENIFVQFFYTTFALLFWGNNKFYNKYLSR